MRHRAWTRYASRPQGGSTRRSRHHSCSIPSTRCRPTPSPLPLLVHTAHGAHQGRRRGASCTSNDSPTNRCHAATCNGTVQHPYRELMPYAPQGLSCWLAQCAGVWEECSGPCQQVRVVCLAGSVCPSPQASRRLWFHRRKVARWPLPQTILPAVHTLVNPTTLAAFSCSCI